MAKRTPYSTSIGLSIPFFLVQGVFILSLITILIYSFCRRGPYGEIVYEFSFENYVRLFSDFAYWRIAFRSLFLATGNTALCLLCGYPVAYFIAKSTSRVKVILIALLILPFASNFLIRTYAWIFILRNEGLLDSLFNSIGVQAPSLLFTEQAVFIGMFYNYLPFMVLPLCNNLHRFDFALVDAARDLGANRFQSFLSVTLPMSMPGILTGFLLVFIPSLGEFVVPDLLGGARSIMLGNLIKMQFFEGRNWPFGAAITVVLSVAIFSIMLMFRRFSRRVELFG